MKKLILYLILLLFIIPSFADQQDKYKVIKIIDGDTFYVDFNQNSIPDADERIRVNGIDTFETKPNDRLLWQIKEYNLTYDEALGMGYLGKEFAKKELLNKYVKVEYTAESKVDNNNRPLMSIYYDCDKKGVCKNYEQEILNEGLAKIYSKSNLAVKLAIYENPSKYKQQLEKAHKLNLVVLNKNNGKYHKTTCEYRWIAAKYKVAKKIFTVFTISI